jgi:hypothetical protein
MFVFAGANVFQNSRYCFVLYDFVEVFEDCYHGLSVQLTVFSVQFSYSSELTVASFTGSVAAFHETIF